MLVQLYRENVALKSQVWGSLMLAQLVSGLERGSRVQQKLLLLSASEARHQTHAKEKRYAEDSHGNCNRRTVLIFILALLASPHRGLHIMRLPHFSS